MPAFAGYVIFIALHDIVRGPLTLYNNHKLMLKIVFTHSILLNNQNSMGTAPDNLDRQKIIFDLNTRRI